MSIYTESGYSDLLTINTLQSDTITNVNIDAVVGQSSINLEQTTLETIKTNQSIKSDNFVTGSSGWQISGEGNVEFNDGIFRGTLLASSIHIPNENTTANSFHSDSDGNSWWGCTHTNFSSDNDNAKAYILKTGVAKFQDILLEGSVILKDLQAGSVVSGDYVDALSVGKLSSGTVTSKSITLSVSDGTGDSKIQAGKTDFTNTESGFILGIDDSDSNKAKFYIGDSTYHLSWDGATLDVVGSAKFQSIFTAAEDIAANDAVCIQEFYKGGSSSGLANITACTYVYQSVPDTNYGSDATFSVYNNIGEQWGLLMLDKTLAGDGFTLALVRNSGPDRDPYVNIANAAWVEGTVTWNTKPGKGKYLGQMSSSDGTNYTFTASDLTSTDVSNINSYGLILSFSTPNADTTQFNSDDAASNKPQTNVETGGTSGSWIIKANSASNNFRANQFIGFATEAISANSSGIVQMSGIVSGFSNLTPGSTYYLSNTSGLISISAGSQSRKIGIAISSSQIFIKHDNP